MWLDYVTLQQEVCAAGVQVSALASIKERQNGKFKTRNALLAKIQMAENVQCQNIATNCEEQTKKHGIIKFNKIC